MVTAVISSAFASAFVIAVTVTGCIAFAVIMELTDENRRPALALLSRNITVYVIPLIFLFAYIVIIWGVKSL